MSFKVSLPSVTQILEEVPESSRDIAFQTIIRNRMQRGGIMAPGAGLIRGGENDNGLSSRWYPATLSKRIRAISNASESIRFVHGDGFEAIDQLADVPDAVFFIDAPYTAGSKKAGKRLYGCSDIDHVALFDAMQRVKGAFLMSYENDAAVRKFASEKGFSVEAVGMKNAHNTDMKELLIMREADCPPEDQS